MAAAPGSYSLTWANIEEIVAEAERHGFGQHEFGYFVETGTLLGQTVIPLAHRFREVHTIEITPGGFAAARLRAWQAKGRIHFHQGDTLEVLPRLLPQLTGPAVLFLDAHFSGGLLQSERHDYMTGGAFAKVPLLEELRAVDQLLPHAALVMIDDMDLFGREHAFDELKTDWRGIDEGAVNSCFQPERLACAFPMPRQNRYIVGMRPSSSPATGPGLVGLPLGPRHHVSAPGAAPLDAGLLHALRGLGEGWNQIANLVSLEFFQHTGGGIGDPATAAPEPPPARKPPRARSVRVSMARDEALAMQTELMVAFSRKSFQHRLHAAWDAAGGNKVKQMKARQEICMPIQAPILERYGFEPSLRGVMESVGLVRKDFWEDAEIMEQAALMDWLVKPNEQWRLAGFDLHVH